MSSLPALISPIAVAPMIDWTNTHFRVFMRLLAPRALLYTEMQTTGSIQHNPKRALFYSKAEEPIALQIGGADKAALVLAAKIAEDHGFAEVNLNLGCPSNTVQAGQFGACLMGRPDEVFEIMQAMKQAVSIPVTAKTRIGIDNQDSYAFFASFAQGLIDAGCDKLIVHARKAWLKGLSPKQNRSIPPLKYEYVYRIKEALPNIPVVINGNIQTLEQANLHMQRVDGVMFGRLSYQNPYALTLIHQDFFPQETPRSRLSILQDYREYVWQSFRAGISLNLLLKPLFNFAHGLPNATFWKAQLMLAQQQKKMDYVESALSFFRDSI